jgi:hypothetical protein
MAETKAFMTLLRSTTACLAAWLVATGSVRAQAPEAERPVAASTIGDLEAIDRVWSGHRVGFALVTSPTRIYVAYYDANRQLTLAQRPRSGGAWIYHKVDCWTGWDSHNYIAMAVDADEQVHVVANLHVDPLNYFSTRKAGDIRTLERVARMVDPAVEGRMTYPIFLRDGEGRLLFKYRDGGSGDGNEIYNVYDLKARTWSHLLRTPLTDGQGQRNAYFVGPVLGPDKAFHIAWVWRETPDASTNHDLSYARSKDLVHWRRSDGTPLALPITLGKAEVVDPVPVDGGMINNNTVLGFDAEGRPMITYHKFDKAGNTQIYVARREKDGWNVAQVSNWKDFRWDFRGGGSLNSLILVGGARPEGPGRLGVPVVREGRAIDFVLDSGSLKPLEARAVVSLADQLKPRIAVPEGMTLNVVEDASTAPVRVGELRYALAWAASPPNRDRPTADIPPPTVLRLVELR